MLQGGTHDGKLFTLLGPEVKETLRIATSDEVSLHPDDASVELYARIDASPMTSGGEQWMASYRWAGQRDSAAALIDIIVE